MPREQSQKLATYGTQDEEKHNTNITQYVLDTTIRNQVQITCALLQITGDKDEPNILFMWKIVTDIPIHPW